MPGRAVERERKRRAGIRRCARPCPRRARSPSSRRPKAARRAPRAGSPWSRPASAMPASALPTSRASPSMASPRMSGAQARAARASAAAASSESAARDQTVLDAREAAVARLRRLARRGRADARSTRAGAAMRVAREDRQRLGEVVGSGDRRAGGDDGEVVAGHVGNDAGVDHARRLGGGGEAPPLIAERCLRTQFISRDVGAAVEQRLVDRLLVVEAEAGRGQRRAAPSRRRKSGTERDRRRVRPRTARRMRARRLLAGRVRHGMGGLDDLDAARRRAVAVAGDDEAFERPVPGCLDRGAPSPPPPCRRRRRACGRAGARAGTKRASSPAAPRQSPSEKGPSGKFVDRACRPSCLSREGAYTIPVGRDKLSRPARSEGGHFFRPFGSANALAKHKLRSAPARVRLGEVTPFINIK